ncbi:MAG: hypothetical protein DMF68_01600 [Acidobacteria bacterium]|nr:MAG: hypothetical protein DMF68_01600 [Acidobacteriota bacterium]
MADNKDLSINERVTRLEGKVEALAENYASQIWVQERVNKIDLALERMEAAIENTNQTISQVAKRFEQNTAETSRQLTSLFKMHSRTLTEQAEQKLEQERKLFEEKLANEQRRAAEERATIKTESIKRIEVLESQKIAADTLAEKRRFINQLKDWKIVLGFILALGAATGGAYALLKWLITNANSK